MDNKLRSKGRELVLILSSTSFLSQLIRTVYARYPARASFGASTRDGARAM